MSVTWRLIAIGLLVVFGSTAASMLVTHYSYGAFGSLTYSSSMLMAAIIPLIVAPISYSYIAVLTYRLEKANKLLDELARHDVLTGLLNRRAFAEEARRRLETAEPHVFIMADIDHFKRINDTLGHSIGDQALQHAATVFASLAPPDSIVARIGGEEFAMLLTQAEVEGKAATQLLGAVRTQLNAMQFPRDAAISSMTCSYGLAASRPGEELDSLLLRADQALYMAKQNGRDCVAHAA